MRSSVAYSLLWASASTAATLPLEARDDPCAHQTDFREFIGGDLNKAKDFWNGLNATDSLSQWLIDHKTNQNWVNDYLGAPYDCASFPSSANCRSPDANSCKNFNPPVKYYIQTAIANQFGAFVQWHEGLQDTILQGITTDVKEISDDWAPPEVADDKVLDLIFGIFGAAIPFAGEEAAGPLEKLLGAAEMFGSLSETHAGTTTADELKSDLMTALGKAFTQLQTTLKTTVMAAFEGTKPPVNCNLTPKPLSCSTTGGPVIGKRRLVLSPAQRVAPITKMYADGVLVDSDIVDQATKAWIDSTKSLILQGLVVQAWTETSQDKFAKYMLRLDTPQNGDASRPGAPTEASCKAQKHTIWDAKDGCYCFTIYKSIDSFAGIVDAPCFGDDEIKKASKHIPDIDKALANAVACQKSGGTADMSAWGTVSSITGKAQGTYPDCFFKMNFWNTTAYQYPIGPGS